MTCTPASLCLPAANRRHRVLPVRAWLQTGAAAAAIGFALTGAPTAGADDGTAARDTGTDSATSTSAPRASAGPAKNRIKQPAAPQRPGETVATRPSAIGKALFSSSGKIAQAPQIYVSRGSTDVYLGIDDPALALWSRPQTDLRTNDAVKFAFPEWLRGTPYNRDPNVWVQETLQDVRQRLDASPLGVFTPALPPFSYYGYPNTNGDGVSVTRYFGTMVVPDVDPPKPFGDGSSSGYNGPKEAFRELLNAIAAVTPQPTCKSAQPRCNTIVLSGGNDVVMPGWIGNAVINTGAGNDIILASPEVNIAVYFGFSGVRVFPEAQVFYPTPYALQGTPSNANGNVFIGGTGRDVIYYDGSVAEAYGGTEDDILAPSFGSFNWAFDTLIQQTLTATAADYQEKDPVKDFGPPLTVYFTLGKDNSWPPKFLEGQAVVSGPKALLGPNTDLRRIGIPSEYLRQTYDFNGYERKINQLNIGLVADAAGGNLKIDDATVNRLGGQKLYGGEGDDLIYGLDPDFYQGFKTAADGKGLRVPFNNPGADGKVDGRQYAQVFESVQMFGGSGQDYFALGNPGNIDPGRFDGNYLYRISGNSDSFKNKGTADFGVLEGDVFEVNLTYEGANWTSSVASPSTGGGVETVAKVVKGGFDAIKVVGEIAKKISEKAFLANPAFAAVAGLGSFVASIVPLFAPEAEKPITPESPFYRDPIGNWRKAIQIQDWDPADSITIHVDPSNSASDSNRRWDQVQFGIINTTDTTNEGALTITAQVGGEAAPRPLISLERFAAKDGVAGTWWAWDFRQAGGKGAYVPITKDNLSFFGQVDPAKASVLVPYVDQYSFPVAQGTPLFRWTDDSLKNNENLLNTLRSNSERIVIQLDTMSLGYYWDIRYLGEASGPDTPINNLSVDQQASKLWVVNPDPGAAQRWIGYSLEDLAANPDLSTKATPIWSLGNPNNTAT